MNNPCDTCKKKKCPEICWAKKDYLHKKLKGEQK